MNDLDLTPPIAGAKPQNAFDIFGSDWAYDIPVPGTKTGAWPVFHILPIAADLLRKHFPNHADLTVFEMGPHEGEHSFHLHHLPVKHVHAVEGRPRNYLKALIVKNELRLDRVYFGLGDAVKSLEGGPRYDLTYCCGLLYHLPDPITALRVISEKSDALVMTTAAYDRREMHEADLRTQDGPHPTDWLRDIDETPEMIEFKGLSVPHYRRHFRSYGVAQAKGHGGVNTPVAHLLTAESIKQIIKKLGGKILHFKKVVYPRAPEVEVVAQFR